MFETRDVSQIIKEPEVLRFVFNWVPLLLGHGSVFSEGLTMCAWIIRYSNGRPVPSWVITLQESCRLTDVTVYERFLVSSSIPENWGGRTPFSSLCNVNVGVDLTKKESFEMKTEGRLSSTTSICMYLSYMYFPCLYCILMGSFSLHPPAQMHLQCFNKPTDIPSSLEKHGRRGSSWWMSADAVRRREIELMDHSHTPTGTYILHD